MISIKQVNKLLPEGYELVKGKGYFYFSGNDALDWETSSVYVYKISDLPLERWLEEFNYLRSEYGK